MSEDDRRIILVGKVDEIDVNSETDFDHAVQQVAVTLTNSRGRVEIWLTPPQTFELLTGLQDALEGLRRAGLRPKLMAREAEEEALRADNPGPGRPEPDRI